MLLRRRVGLLRGRALITEAARMALAAVLAAVVALGVWWPLDSALGRSTAGQLGSLVPALAAAGAVYLASARALGLAEIAVLRSLLRR